MSIGFWRLESEMPCVLPGPRDPALVLRIFHVVVELSLMRMLRVAKAGELLECGAIEIIQ